MKMIRVSRPSRAVAIAVALALALAPATLASAGHHRHHASSKNKDRVQVDVSLDSVSTVYYHVGTATTYGWDKLDGTGTSDARSVAVEMLTSVLDTNGVGPFSGYATFVWPGGTMGFQVSGRTTRGVGRAVDYNGKLRMIGGTGSYATYVGKGTVAGSRGGGANAPVVVTFVLKVHAA